MIRRQSDRRQNRPFKLLEPERRRNWYLPMIAGLLALILIGREVGAAEVVGGLDGKRAAYVLTRNPPCKPACIPPLVREFTVKIPLPNRLDRGWW